MGTFGSWVPAVHVSILWDGHFDLCASVLRVLCLYSGSEFSKCLERQAALKGLEWSGMSWNQNTQPRTRL